MNGRALLSGGLAFCADKLVIGGGDAGLPAAATPATALAESDTLRALVTRFAAAHGGAPWQPACSMWSQWYFGTLLAPAVTWLLADEAPPAMALGDVHVVLCPEKVVPLAFHAAPAPLWPPRGARSLAPLLLHHLPPVVEALRSIGDLSGNLLWENASWPLAWALGVLDGENPRLRPAIVALLDDAGLPAPQRRLLGRVRAVALEGQPFRRRLCCLRDRMPGMVNCGDLCPLGRHRR